MLNEEEKLDGGTSLPVYSVSEAMSESAWIHDTELLSAD